MITEKLIILLDTAIDEFYLKDWQLIDLGVHERTCVARIAHYLQNLLDKDPIWHDISVDCEYNRQTEETQPEDKPAKKIKKTSTSYSSVFPDLIVHCRDKNDRNLLVAQFKIGGTQYEQRGRDKDIEIVRALMEDPQKHYWCGVYVVLGQEGHIIEKITTEKKNENT